MGFCLSSFLSLVLWCDGEVIGDLHLESITAAEVDHRLEEDRVHAGWQWPQQDPVTIGDPVLLRARQTRVEGDQRGICCECEQPRRSAVIEQIVQGPPIDNDFE